MYVYMYICMYVCIYIYRYIYVYICIHELEEEHEMVGRQRACQRQRQRQCRANPPPLPEGVCFEDVYPLYTYMPCIRIYVKIYIYERDGGEEHEVVGG